MPNWEAGIVASPRFPEIVTRSGRDRASRGDMNIPSSLEWGLLVAATVLNGIFAGGVLIKSVVELPTRRTIGLTAMAAFHRAADLRTGFLIYPALGVRPLLSRQHSGPPSQSSEKFRQLPHNGQKWTFHRKWPACAKGQFS